MTEDESKQEEGISAGPEPGKVISLEEARVAAMQTAQDVPGTYGEEFKGVRMVYRHVAEEENEDYLSITLSFRPGGSFSGPPGKEQFFIQRDNGSLAGRQVLTLPRIKAQRRFGWWPLGIAIVALGAVITVGAAFAAGILGSGGGSQQGVGGLEAVPGPDTLRLFLVPAASSPYSLSLAHTGLGKVAVVPVPLVHQVDYTGLRRHLWTETSLMFTATAFSDAWAPDDIAQLILQLNGPFDGLKYSSCVALGLNGVQQSFSCANKISNYEYQPGGYRVILDLPVLERIEPTDLLELSVAFGTSLGEGEEVVPNLVYGGNAPLKISYLDIGVPPIGVQQN